MASFAPNLAEATHQIDKLTALVASTTHLEPAHRKLIAEVVLVRLSILVEAQTRSICCKIACGTRFLDGSNPILLHPSRSAAAALAAMKTLNRPKDRHPVWNDGRGIRDTIKHVVDPADPTHRCVTNYASYLTEIRYVRNHIAHNNHTTRSNYKSVVRTRYGAYPRGVTPGTLLLTAAFGPIPLLNRYLTTGKIYVRDLTRA